MQIRIGHLRCRYRVLGAAAVASSAGTDGRMEAARREALRGLDDSLAERPGEDPTVYVLRRVDASLTLVDPQARADAGAAVGGTSPASRLAEHWAGAGVRGIARGRAGVDVMTFA